MKKPIPIPEEIIEFLNYDEITGKLTWIKKHTKCTKIGKVAGYTNKVYGYVDIIFNKVYYRAHRIAWFLKTGNQPPDEIDHHDKDKTNNSWSNLREATRDQNNQNKGKHPNNTSGIKGVSWDKQHEKWRSQIQYKGVKTHLGFFDDPKEAHIAYCNKADELHKEFANYG